MWYFTLPIYFDNDKAEHVIYMVMCHAQCKNDRREEKEDPMTAFRKSSVGIAIRNDGLRESRRNFNQECTTRKKDDAIILTGSKNDVDDSHDV